VLTLWPEAQQEFTLIGQWKAEVRTGQDAAGKIKVLQSTGWNVQAEAAKVIPVLSIKPFVPVEVELVADRTAACEMAKVSGDHSEQSAIFFGANGRLKRRIQDERHAFSIRPDNQRTFRSELAAVCAA
jgi:hypothetical protein